MKYYDLNSRLFEKETSQDRLLEWLYTSRFGKIILKILVSPAVSKAGGAFLGSPFSVFLIKPFIKRNGIDMSCYEKESYNSYNRFFTRRIKKGMRPLMGDESNIISPCDGKVSCYRLDEGAVFEIKRGRYDCASLLKDKRLADRFRGGYAFVIRLTVDDYHRYCYCCEGIKSENRHIDGIFHTVNPVAFSHYPVFKENAREYCVISSKSFGSVVQMEVGATMVGRISNLHKGRRRVKKGEEKGKFEFGGSTVVVLVEKGAVKAPEVLLERTQRGCETVIKQGMVLA